jgi:hypothetical protein
MTTYTEPLRPLEFLISEDLGAGQRSRSQETLTASQGALLPGTVMAKVTSTGHLVPYDDDANGTTAGVGIAVGILCYPAENSASTQLVTIIARDAVVQSDLLQWEASNDNTEKAAALAELLALGIVAR